ncbi:MAG: hypothetical protein HPY69_08780 [Armatimonadetes bacterium]|nr:hypothetical protein [Armatimonadota bacterium]
MRLGFAKSDITPRVGVELCGFGPYLNRHSVGVRDRLWSRAMAIEVGDRRAVIISNDLAGVSQDVTAGVRERIRCEAGLPPEAVVVHCTHTHSGPTTFPLNGWGDVDAPYMEVLPGRLASAAMQALANLQEAALHHAEVPCEGIGLNREYDRDAPPLEQVLQEDWRPFRPELTDTTCHVLSAWADGRLLGFASYFGCHPVVCCAASRYIHGDYAGVATNLLEREHPGSVGLFLQGAQGDVNTCVVHKAEQESLLALDTIAGRYARSVREGIRAGRPVAVDCLSYVIHPVEFSRRGLTREQIRERLAEQEAITQAPGASDEDGQVRMATVYAQAYRRLLRLMDEGKPLSRPVELQGLRLGPLALLGCPFEVMQTIKNEVRLKAQSPVPLVMGITNDLLGYAPDRTAARRGGYAADTVPLMLGILPFANLHDELVAGLLAVDAALRSPA